MVYYTGNVSEKGVTIVILDCILTAIAFLFLVCIWSMVIDGHRFVVREWKAADKRIKKPCRCIVLSDLHNKQYGPENALLLQKIRQLEPDLIFAAGDICTATPGKSFEPALAFLGELAKEFPVCYANGNHEQRMKLYPKTYGDMAKEYGEGLEKIGIRPLVNEHTLLEEYGLCVFGLEIDKKFYNRFQRQEMSPAYVEECLGRPDPEHYTVLLAHNPEYFDAYAGWGADLTISGHVHGGVARVPFWGKGVISPRLRLFPKYDGGIFSQNDRTMLLSRGLGEHTIPIRVFNPGELWVIDFEKQDA